MKNKNLNVFKRPKYKLVRVMPLVRARLSSPFEFYAIWRRFLYFFWIPYYRSYNYERVKEKFEQCLKEEKEIEELNKKE